MLNEQKILQIYSDDPQKGFRLLMDQYQEPVYYFVRRQLVSHDDAEDVTQEVFIRVFRGLDGFRRDSSLTTWIYTIATNEVLRWLEKRRVAEMVPAEAVQEQLVEKLRASEYVDYENELSVKFQAAVLSLPEKQRLVFNLRYYDELDYEEIARILGGKPEAMKVNYHYAKDRIKEYILNN